jgi:hypothetical protein
LFGLCDLGIGSPEIDYVLRSEIEEVGVKIGCYRMPLERDEHFKANKTLGEYADDANEVGRIVASADRRAAP